MSAWEVVAGAALGVAATEFTDISPWLARKLVQWAAYRWTADPDIAAMYAEEWTAIVEERPGKLLKLFTAVGFAVGAAGRAAPRVASVIRSRIRLLFLASSKSERLGQWVGAALGMTGGGVLMYVALQSDNPQRNAALVALVLVALTAVSLWGAYVLRRRIISRTQSLVSALVSVTPHQESGRERRGAGSARGER